MTIHKRWSFVATTAVLGALGIAGAHQQASADDVQVKSGDTVSQIAEAHNTTVDKVVALNNLQNPNLIFIGETLKVSEDLAQVQATPVAQPSPEPASTPVTAPVTQSATTATTSTAQTNASVNVANYGAATSSSAKAWIAFKESSNNYNARNGQFIGKYQLSADKLHGDYSPENQERTADAYVNARYGSWEKAQSFWQANGWY